MNRHGLDERRKKKFFVNFANPMGQPAFEYPDFNVRIPSAVPDPLTTIVGQPMEGIDLGVRILFFPQERLFESVRQCFVRVNRQNIVADGLFISMVFCRREPIPGKLKKPNTLFNTNFFRFVGRERIDYDNLIG